ncbi:MAG: hypothetical protein E4H01_12220 [Lysobacterales bacterium]|nr:MAG: hypothetical protein E4H01_12220 [Xanthomonadales bacterium]
MGIPSVEVQIVRLSAVWTAYRLAILLGQPADHNLAALDLHPWQPQREERRRSIEGVFSTTLRLSGVALRT